MRGARRNPLWEITTVSKGHAQAFFVITGLNVAHPRVPGPGMFLALARTHL